MSILRKDLGRQRDSKQNALEHGRMLLLVQGHMKDQRVRSAVSNGEELRSGVRRAREPCHGKASRAL